MADKDIKYPARPFNKAAKGQEMEVIFEPDFDEKFLDNTDPRQEPTHKHHIERTPSGTNSVYKASQSDDHGQTVRPAAQSKPENKVDLSRNDINYEPNYNGFNVLLMVHNKPQKQGINNGRVTKLVLASGEQGQDNIHARFEDGEWKRRAQLPIEQQSIMEALHEYDPDCLRKKNRAGDKSDEAVLEQKRDNGKDTGFSR